MNKPKKSYYKLFSINLLRFIKLHGFRPISKGVHPVTGKGYWIFEMNDDLSQVLTTWSKNRAVKTKNTELEWKIGQ